MIVALKGEIIKSNNKSYLNAFGALIEIRYINYCNPDNQQQIVYVKKHSYLNEKQTIEDNIIVFHNLNLLRSFLDILSLNGFGLKTTINIFNNKPNNFIELKNNGEFEKIKDEYKLNTKQITSLIQTSNKKIEEPNSKKMTQLINALENLGYKKAIIKKCLINNQSLLEETNFSILLKRFVELVKNEL